jgi:hypothetical protein
MSMQALKKAQAATEAVAAKLEALILAVAALEIRTAALEKAEPEKRGPGRPRKENNQA